MQICSHKFTNVNTMISADRLELLVQVASWYYEENLDQETIAQRVGRSRSMVSRLLQEAREQGLVDIRVRYPLKTDSEIAQRLCDTFALDQAWVLADPPADYNLLLRRLGELGARCLQQYLHDGIRIGLGWGTAIYEVVQAIPAVALRDALVVQIIGAVGYGNPIVDGPELARWLAQKLNGSYRFLHAPLIVENETIAQALLQERSIAETLALGKQAEVMLVGIGAVEPELSSLHRAGYLSREELLALEQAGAVGDLLARQLDAQGRPLDIPLHRRVVGLENLEILRSVPVVMAIAGGVAKAQAIAAALRGGYVKVLIADTAAASTILKLS